MVSVVDAHASTERQRPSPKCQLCCEHDVVAVICVEDPDLWLACDCTCVLGQQLLFGFGSLLLSMALIECAGAMKI